MKEGRNDVHTEYQAPTGGSDGAKVPGHRDLDAAVVGSRDEAPPILGWAGRVRGI